MDGVEFHVTATCGVVEINADISDPAKLLRAADIAMYRGKEGGRNRVVAHTPEL
jgi:PleD family two-component response regulator